MDMAKVDNLEYLLRKVAKGKSLISFSDLQSILKTCEGDKGHDASIMFKECDYDSTGRLDTKKLRIYFQEQGVEISDSEIKAMITMESESGSLDLEQFKRVMTTV